MKFSFTEEIPEVARKQLGEFDDLIARLLFHRGITTEESAQAFVSPDYDAHTHDPFLMAGMDRAVERILKAIDTKERFTVHTDYDTDGIPAGVLLHDFFKKVDAHFENYIPHRHNEGYGLSVQAVERHAQEGSTLILTADCGITDVAAVARANELGVDVIITDHHIPHEKLPDAYVILDPKLPDNTYPFNELCGAGIAYKLVQALLSRGNFDVPHGWEKWLLDMAGLATIADMVPLVGENRVLATYGLLVLRKSPRPGLRTLLRLMRVNQQMLTEDDVGYMIGPRINAASRMGEPMRAFHLLTTTDQAEAERLAKELESTNRKRKTAVATITKEVKRKIRGRSTDRAVIVAGDPEWRPALLGLVANSVVEEYNRPVFLWGREGNGILKGSCRGNESVNLVELMQKVESYFLGIGGHADAGGFSVSQENVHHLEEVLHEAYQGLDTTQNENELVLDGELELEQVDMSLWRKIDQLAPFGMSNPKPLFLFRSTHPSEVVWFGKNKDHLKLKFSNRLEAIAFFAKRDLGSQAENVSINETCSFIGSVEFDPFRSSPRIRIHSVQD